MALAGSSPPPSVAIADLKQLWEQGQRAAAIRKALDSWDHLVGQPVDLGWLQETLRRCGLESESFAVQAQMTRRRRTEAREWEALIRSALLSGDPWWCRELLEESGCASRDLQALRVEVDLALGDASSSISAWLREHKDDAAIEAAAKWWVRSGRVEEAERLATEHRALGLWRARLAIWRNQPEVAKPLLENLLPSPEVQYLQAVATVQEGRLAEAEPLLRNLLGGELQAEAWSWLASLLRKTGRYSEAVKAADAANIASSAFNLVPLLEREVAVEYENAAARRKENESSLLFRVLSAIGLATKRPGDRSKARIVGDLEYSRALFPLGAKAEDPVAPALEAILERLGGNRTPDLTTVEGDKLVSHRLPMDPRHLGASAQLVLWTRGVEAARELFRELSPQVEDHPLFRIYQGELELWLGAYADAERIFREILAREEKVRWAWIGLGASRMLQGDLREAQTLWKKGLALMGFPGPTLFVYRGECHRRQGDRKAARNDLEVALRQKPQRLSTRINLALLDGEPEALAKVERECAEHAPLLMEELSGTTAEKLEKVLEAMRGNRSSSPSLVCYHLWGRVWRRAS